MQKIFTHSQPSCPCCPSGNLLSLVVVGDGRMGVSHQIGSDTSQAGLDGQVSVPWFAVNTA